MTNPLKGEVSFTHAGESWTLVLDFNALCEAETAMGGSIGDLSSMGAIRAVFWGGLRRHHPGITLFEAGDLIGEVGFEKAAKLVTDAFAVSGLTGGDGAAKSDPPRAVRRASASKRR